MYFNKVKNKKSEDKGGLHQWLQGVLFSLYDCNSVPVYGTYITWSVVAIIIEFPFQIYLSP